MEADRVLQSVDLDRTTWYGTGPRADDEFPGKIGIVKTYRLHLLQSGYGFRNQANPKKERILIPFGKLLTEKLRKALEESLPGSLLCQRESCSTSLPPGRTFDRRVVLKVDSFDFWEEPMNHVNYKARIVTFTEAGAEGKQDEQDANYELLAQKVGHIWSKETQFLIGIQESANIFTDRVVSGIIADASRRCPSTFFSVGDG
jgi:hypothetical protein